MPDWATLAAGAWSHCVLNLRSDQARTIMPPSCKAAALPTLEGGVVIGGCQRYSSIVGEVKPRETLSQVVKARQQRLPICREQDSESSSEEDEAPKQITRLRTRSHPAMVVVRSKSSRTSGSRSTPIRKKAPILPMTSQPGQLDATGCDGVGSSVQPPRMSDAALQCCHTMDLGNARLGIGEPVREEDATKIAPLPLKRSGVSDLAAELELR